MTAALAGVLGYFLAGTLELLRTKTGPCWGLVAWAGGLISLALWAPGFPESKLGGPLWGISLVGDPIALAFWCFIPLVHAAVGWHERRRPATFHGLVTLLVGTCLATVLSRDLFNLFVCLELNSLLSFLLIGFDARSRAVWASLQYLILTTVGMILYLVGLGLVYGELGTLSLAQISTLAVDFSTPSLAVGAGLLVAGAAVKAGVFLLGLWLPLAYREAPTGVSTLLAGLVGKMGIVTLARLAQALPVGPLVVSLGVVTGFGGLIYALWERDLKVFLAYQVMSQVGYMLIGFGLGGPAFFGALLYTVACCLYKGLLFQAAGQAVEAVGKRDILSLAGRLPSPAAIGLAVGTAAIVGLPPLAGFVGKELLGVMVPPAFSWTLTVLTLGTAASFSKLLPLFRMGPAAGERGAVALLTAGVLGFSSWGLLSLPNLWAPSLWLRALAVVAVGFGLHLVIHRLDIRLPKIGLDRAALVSLVGSVGLALATVLWL